MKKIYAALLLFINHAAIAQDASMTYQYADNKSDLKIQQDFYTPKASGEGYCKQVASFMTLAGANMKPYLTREAFHDYLKQFNNSVRSNAIDNKQTLNKVSVFYKTISDLSDLEGSDDYRFQLYKFSYPVYKALNEAWEDDIVNAAISDGSLNLADYINLKAVDDGNLKDAMTIIDNNRGLLGSAEKCNYKVAVDSPILKNDKIEVLFCNDAIYRKAAPAYTGKLLNGPIKDWQDHKSESDAMMNIVKYNANLSAHTGQRVYAAAMTNPKANKMEQGLDSDAAWFILVFRNGMLYYSYMIAPCGPRNNCHIH